VQDAELTLADTQAIAFLTGRTPATIRSWAHRGLITRRGTGPRGRALYAIEDAEAVVDKQHSLVQHQEHSRSRAP
jgi:DNA-binding transcriptional MerR regulator